MLSTFPEYQQILALPCFTLPLHLLIPRTYWFTYLSIAYRHFTSKAQLLDCGSYLAMKSVYDFVQIMCNAVHLTRSKFKVLYRQIRHHIEAKHSNIVSKTRKGTKTGSDHDKETLHYTTCCYKKNCAQACWDAWGFVGSLTLTHGKYEIHNKNKGGGERHPDVSMHGAWPNTHSMWDTGSTLYGVGIVDPTLQRVRPRTGHCGCSAQNHREKDRQPIVSLSIPRFSGEWKRDQARSPVGPTGFSHWDLKWSKPAD